MKQFLMVFYVVFFSTGFMGGAALVLLQLRVRSRMLRPLLVFQVLFLIGTGLILLYFTAAADGLENRWVQIALPAVIMAINTAVWITVIVMVRRITPDLSRRHRLAWIAQGAAVAVLVKSAINVVVLSTVSPNMVPGLWHLSSHILTAIAMATFGLILRGPVTPKEPPALHSLFKAYGTLSIVFAPAGILEFAAQSLDIPTLQYLSFDHFLYLAWNIVSMTATIQLFKPVHDRSTILESVPEERIRALGLSAREVEMAILIAKGLTNKEIASQLYISPATVRTHIYNLYQKVGAGSRVELLNMLRD